LEKISLLSEKLGTKIKIENGIGTVELKEAFHWPVFFSPANEGKVKFQK
jgi:hypothetical protein